jgi:hypothetical protein
MDGQKTEERDAPAIPADERYYVWFGFVNEPPRDGSVVVLRIYQEYGPHRVGLMSYFEVPAGWPVPQSHADAARYYARLALMGRMPNWVSEDCMDTPDALGRCKHIANNKGNLWQYAARLRAEHG